MTIPLPLFITIFRRDMPFFHDVITELDAAVARGVALARKPGFRIYYVSTNGYGAPIRPADANFDGHDICARDSWVWGIRFTPYPPPTSLHPNIAGNQAMARIVRYYADQIGVG